MSQFKQFIDYVTKNIPEDTEVGSEVVQQMACVIGMRLSHSNKLPVAYGKGYNLDMDAVQEAILVGLEILPAYLPEKGSLRQFLYKHMAGRMMQSAWRRENRVAPSIVGVTPEILDVYHSEDEGSDDNDLGDAQDRLNELGQVPSPEDEMIADEELKSAYGALGRAMSALEPEERGLIARSAHIGRNKPKRDAMAESLGILPASLSMRLVRIRQKARRAVTTEE